MIEVEVEGRALHLSLGWASRRHGDTAVEGSLSRGMHAHRSGISHLRSRRSPQAPANFAGQPPVRS